MKIKAVMIDEDSPYSTYVFHVINDEVFYERIEGVNEDSFLDEDYIDYINKVYGYMPWRCKGVLTTS